MNKSDNNRPYVGFSFVDKETGQELAAFVPAGTGQYDPNQPVSEPTSKPENETVPPNYEQHVYEGPNKANLGDPVYEADEIRHTFRDDTGMYTLVVGGSGSWKNESFWFEVWECGKRAMGEPKLVLARWAESGYIDAAVNQGMEEIDRLLDESCEG